MVLAERTIEVMPGSEVDRLLDEAIGTRLILIRDGVRFRLQREDSKEDIWANYDPERVLQVLADTAGAWKEIDTQGLKDDIRAQRGQNSQGRPGDC